MKLNLQSKLDIEKWLDSEVRHADQCGHYAYCAYCENHDEYPCAEAWLKLHAVNAQQTAANEVAQKTHKVKTFADRLVALPLELAEAYVIIDERLTELGLTCHRSALMQSYKQGRKVVAKLSLTARELRLYAAVEPTESVTDVSSKKTFRTTPSLVTVRTYEDVRNAVALISALTL